MKNFAFLIFILITCYAAGMFQYQPLMFLFVLECVYLVVEVFKLKFYKIKFYI